LSSAKLAEAQRTQKAVADALAAEKQKLQRLQQEVVQADQLVKRKEQELAQVSDCRREESVAIEQMEERN
jgi:hypothetical protein